MTVSKSRVSIDGAPTEIDFNDLLIGNSSLIEGAAL
jgi:hypothetical protein